MRVLRAMPPDEAVATVAARQAGRISTRQLRALGLDGAAIHRRRLAGRLHPVARGVHAVGHTSPGGDSELWEVILALGAAAVLLGRTAVAMWDLGPRPPLVEVGLPTSRAQRPGVRLRTTSWMPRAHVRVVRGLPVTSVARTLVDLAADATPRELERAFDAAEVAGRLNHAAVAALLEDGGPRRGTRALRALLGRDAPGTTLTESELEERLLALIRAAGLPEPETQVRIGRYRVDLCWRDLRLVVEADGLAAHGRRRALQRDRRRLNDLTRAGWTVLAFVWDDVVDDPTYVIDTIAEAVRRASGSA